ncbi:MAG: type 4a pilus biogenesis protein PilO [Planctomycetota bacterium]
MIDRLKQQPATWYAGTIVACLLVGLCVDLPFRSVQSRQQDRIDESSRQLGLTPGATEELSRLYDEVEQMRDELDGSKQRVPAQDEIAQVVRGISEALVLHAADQPVLTTGKTEHYATHSLIPVQVSFNADFLNTYRVLDALQRMPRLIRVDRLTISRDAERGDGNATVELEVAAFFSRPGEQLAAVEGGTR